MQDFISGCESRTRTAIKTELRQSIFKIIDTAKTRLNLTFL
jgi:hypothetical protein